MKQCWSKNKLGAFECKLGTLNKAIVLVYSISRYSKNSRGYWRISPSSYLPFMDEQYNKEFDGPEECALYAEGIVLEWLQSLALPVQNPLSSSEQAPMLNNTK